MKGQIRFGIHTRPTSMAAERAKPGKTVDNALSPCVVDAVEQIAHCGEMLASQRTCMMSCAAMVVR